MIFKKKSSNNYNLKIIQNRILIQINNAKNLNILVKTIKFLHNKLNTYILKTKKINCFYKATFYLVL